MRLFTKFLLIWTTVLITTVANAGQYYLDPLLSVNTHAQISIGNAMAERSSLGTAYSETGDVSDISKYVWVWQPVGNPILDPAPAMHVTHQYQLSQDTQQPAMAQASGNNANANAAASFTSYFLGNTKTTTLTVTASTSVITSKRY